MEWGTLVFIRPIQRLESGLKEGLIIDRPPGPPGSNYSHRILFLSLGLLPFKS